MTTQTKQDLQNFVNSFDKLNKWERELIYQKFLLVHAEGLLEGCQDMRELYHVANNLKHGKPADFHRQKLDKLNDMRDRVNAEQIEIFGDIDNGKDITDYTDSTGGEVIVK